jgi:hypothetical protein
MPKRCKLLLDYEEEQLEDGSIAEEWDSDDGNFIETSF